MTIETVTISDPTQGLRRIVTDHTRIGGYPDTMGIARTAHALGMTHALASNDDLRNAVARIIDPKTWAWHDEDAVAGISRDTDVADSLTKADAIIDLIVKRSGPESSADASIDWSGRLIAEHIGGPVPGSPAHADAGKRVRVTAQPAYNGATFAVYGIPAHPNGIFSDKEGVTRTHWRIRNAQDGDTDV